ncbi:MAG: alpha-1,4-glucan--maltose-1-phosphate maltosyltransferase [Longimicrobiales bacterium]
MPARTGQRDAGEGRRRVVIEGVRPEIDCGRFPIKRVIGEPVTVEADIFADGHDALTARLVWRHESQRSWRGIDMESLVNDRWRASFPVERLGRYYYGLVAWVDPFKTWRRDLAKRLAADQDVDIDLRIGAGIVDAAAARAAERDAGTLRAAARSLRSGDMETRLRTATAERLQRLMSRYPNLEQATRYHRELQVVVDPPRANFSAWYELFPRSAGPAGRHGTLRDVIDRLDYVAELGFDVLYLPPVHPIGRTRRKGPNNQEVGDGDAVGSPWAIGAREGGHKAVHPELGTLDDLRALASAARERNIELALDIAFQAAPDHPYVSEHPDWFRTRPDGTVQYAENPPKKYQDIYPFDFETEDWQPLWEELESIFRFWIEQGVRTFRVDNPHTKAFAFWEWAITRLKADFPDLVFLSEAFTRPRVMYRLAKLGYTQSYTYFAWRYTKHDFIEYMTELTQTEVIDYFRPNFWPNTPDILTDQLQSGLRSVFMTRLALAATLSSNYGIYGPAFELMEHVPREPGSEEYLDSEKYQVREWDLEREDSLRDFIARVNTIRRENPALQTNRTLRFLRIDNDQVLAYTKQSLDGSNIILVVINMDAHWTQSGFLELPLAELGLPEAAPYLAHDLLSGARYTWEGAWNFVELNPAAGPVHIMRLEVLEEGPPHA